MLTAPFPPAGVDVHGEGSEKEKPVMLLNHFTSGSTRPTAQVLPVQNEAGSSPSGHHPLPTQMMAAASHLAPIRMLNSVHKSERGGADMKLLPPSVHSLLSLEERSKLSGPRGGIKVDKNFGHAVIDAAPTPTPQQPLQVLSALAESSSVSPTVSFGPRTKVHTSALDRVMKSAPQPALAGEASTAAAGTSGAVFHAARPPIKLLVSSSVPADSAISGQTACSNNVQISVPPAIIKPRAAVCAASTKAAFSAMGSVPLGPLQASFCASSNTASSSSHPSASFASMATVPSCPAPSSSPALSSAPESSFYSSGGGGGGGGAGGGGGGSPGNLPASSQNHHHHHHHQPQSAPQQPAPGPPPGCVVCTSCGCSGSCGSGGLTVSYANYFQHPFSGPSVFPFPFLPFSPVCGSGYVGAQQYGGGAFPVVHSPYGGGVAPEPVLAGQSAFAVPPMPGFMAGAAGVYQAPGLGGGGGSGHKKSGNLSCYNCGATGHRAQDCKQPSMDFNRQGKGGGHRAGCAGAQSTPVWGHRGPQAASRAQMLLAEACPCRWAGREGLQKGRMVSSCPSLQPAPLSEGTGRPGEDTLALRAGQPVGLTERPAGLVQGCGCCGGLSCCCCCAAAPARGTRPVGRGGCVVFPAATHSIPPPPIFTSTRSLLSLVRVRCVCDVGTRACSRCRLGKGDETRQEASLPAPWYSGRGLG